MTPKTSPEVFVPINKRWSRRNFIYTGILGGLGLASLVFMGKTIGDNLKIPAAEKPYFLPGELLKATELYNISVLASKYKALIENNISLDPQKQEHINTIVSTFYQQMLFQGLDEPIAKDRIQHLALTNRSDTHCEDGAICSYNANGNLSAEIKDTVFTQDNPDNNLRTIRQIIQFAHDGKHLSARTVNQSSGLTENYGFLGTYEILSERRGFQRVEVHHGDPNLNLMHHVKILQPTGKPTGLKIITVEEWMAEFSAISFYQYLLSAGLGPLPFVKDNMWQLGYPEFAQSMFDVQQTDWAMFWKNKLSPGSSNAYYLRNDRYGFFQSLGQVVLDNLSPKFRPDDLAGIGVLAFTDFAYSAKTQARTITAILNEPNLDSSILSRLAINLNSLISE